MKRLLTILLFALTLRAQEDPPFLNSGSVTAEADADSRQSSLFDPDFNLYDPPLRSRLLRINDDFTANLPRELSLRGKVSAEFSHDRDTKLTRGQVRELYLSRAFGDVTVHAGRRILKWTNGYAFSPAGVLDPPRNASDPTDRLGRLGGRDLAQLDWFRGQQTLSLVYGLPTNTRAAGGERVFAARYNALIKGFDVSAIVAIPAESPERIATTFSYVIGQALEIHGEASLQRGTSVVQPNAAFTDKLLFGNDYFVTHDDDDTRLRALAGINLTFRDGTNLVAEYYHTDEGLTSSEWTNFIDQSETAASLRNDPRFGPIQDGMNLPQLNLLQGLSYLRGQELQRDYGFVRFARNWRDSTISANALALINLHDGSYLVAPEIAYTHRRMLAIYARATFFFGDARSQYGNVPNGRTLVGGLRRYF